MSDNINNEKVNLDKRFSEEKSISDYTPIVYQLNEQEVIKSGGITCIGRYCSCKDKNNCDCLKNMIEFITKGGKLKMI